MSDSIYSKGHKEIVKKLKSARVKAGYTQQEIARVLKKTQSQISKLEAGQRKIDIVELKKLAKVYGRKIEDFLK